MSANGFKICCRLVVEKIKITFFFLVILNILSPEPTAGSLLQLSERRTLNFVLKAAYDTANFSNTLLKGQCHEI
jgi:hypothetical protein